ncbi:hypothetical protein [Rodentibacter trehalosifermentans]|uniref:hypothetical protein n=1 Tax=Rodentibacter trehalosifermentans TaxID=1908263 RepID=UPI0011799AB3|nr:hypothetical protein [Rodentibacter trehalosifermentans]
MYSAQMVNCYIDKKTFSAIAYYQKYDSIGHTDINERWKDATSCGAKYNDSDLWSIIKPKDFRKQFRLCMKNKGYRIFDVTECGLKEPKNLNKGLCNE